MRKALVVGIDYYESHSALSGCVLDALSVRNVLKEHGNGSENFGVKLMTGADRTEPVRRSDLRKGIERLFKGDSEIALFYFAGHGEVKNTGGYLLTSDTAEPQDGISLNDLLLIANQSKARNKIIVLDSCFSGAMGNIPQLPDTAKISEGLTILTSSTKYETSIERDGGGVFTRLFVDALKGGARNLMGVVTPGSVYAHIDQSLGPWHQRPVFKTNVTRFIELRKVDPPISLKDLKKITKLFPDEDHEFKLDPSYEFSNEKEPLPVEENVQKFKILQKYVAVNLVEPVGEEHMYFAAMNEKSCRLTVLGKHYHRIIKRPEED